MRPRAWAAVPVVLVVTSACVAPAARGQQTSSSLADALHQAAAAHQAPLVEAELKRGAAVDARDRAGQTALMLACMVGWASPPDTALSKRQAESALRTVEALLRAGASVDAADQMGRTALSYAGGSWAPAIVRKLLSAGAAVDAADVAGCTPLCHTVEAPPLQVSANFVYHARSAHQAEPGESEALATARLLLDAGANADPVDKEGHTPLMAAAEGTRPGLIRLLLEHGADPDRQDPYGRGPLLMAMQPLRWPPDQQPRRMLAAVRLLLSRADPRLRGKDGRSVFFAWWDGACRIEPDRAPDLVRAFVRRGVDWTEVDQRGRTLLMLAARRCQPAAAALAIRHHVPVDARDHDGYTALMQLVFGEGRIEQMASTARVLLSAGANPLAELPHQGKPLPLALALARSGGSRAVALLSLDRMDPNARDGERATLFMEAAAWGRMDVLRALIERHADVNAQDVHGGTALLRAASSGRVEAVRELLAHGARVVTQTHGQWTPLTVPIVEHEAEIRAMLREAADRERAGAGSR